MLSVSSPPAPQKWSSGETVPSGNLLAKAADSVGLQSGSQKQPPSVVGIDGPHRAVTEADAVGRGRSR
jgi:hypothetical protein